MNEEKLIKTREVIFKLFWWAIILIYAVLYVLFMPKTLFGTTIFSSVFYFVNFLTEFYVLARLGGVIR